jgi:branched-chain amino acid transport system permease protein
MKKKFSLTGLSIVVVLIIALAIPLVVENEYYLHTFIISGIYILLTLGLNLILGYTGQLSLGHAAFYGIGAYTSTLLVMELNFPFWLALFCSGLTAGLAGLFLGFPSLRLKGSYLVICTLAFVEIVHQGFMNWESLTRGPMGIPGIPSPAEISIGAFMIDFTEKQTYYYLVLIIVIIALMLNFFLVRSKTGRALIAIREDQIAAGMMGINLTYYKLLSFFCACFLAGIAGSLYVHYIGYVSPESFTLGESINIVVMTVLGGMGTLVGPVIGAIGLTFLLEFMRALAEYRLVIYGFILMIVIVAMPDGTIGGMRLIKEHLVRKSEPFQSL